MPLEERPETETSAGLSLPLAAIRPRGSNSTFMPDWRITLPRVSLTWSWRALAMPEAEALRFALVKWLSEVFLREASGEGTDVVVHT